MPWTNDRVIRAKAETYLSELGILACGMISKATIVLISVILCAARMEGSIETKDVGGIIYRIYRTAPNTIRVLWLDDTGNQLRTFSAAAEHLRKHHQIPLVLTNGGIFEPGGIPSGLLIQDGKELRPINKADGNGNFFLKPNGIFLISPQGAAIVRTDEFPLKNTHTQYAVQSGPILLRQGEIHPAFSATSASRLHRNGVGVARSGEVVFLITDEDSPKRPTLHEFARAFAALGCVDALFLDGDLSQMRTPSDFSSAMTHFGSIIAITDVPVKNKK